MGRPTKQASLDEHGDVRCEETPHGFKFGAASITRLHAERNGERKGDVWMQLETPRGKFEIRVSPSGHVRIWGHQDDESGELKFEALG